MFSGVFKLSCGIIAATVALQGEVSALKLALKWAATVEVPPLEIPSSTSTTTVESEPGLLSPRSWEILEIYNKNVKIHDEVTEALVELEKLVSRKWSEVGFNRDLSSNSIGEFSEIREKIKELYASKLWPYSEGLPAEVRAFLSQLKGPVAVMAQTAWLKGLVDSADEYVTAVRELQEKLWDINERYNLGDEEDADEQRIEKLGCLIDVIREEVTESEHMIGGLQNEVEELHPAITVEESGAVSSEKVMSPPEVTVDEEVTGGDSPGNNRGRKRARSPVKRSKGGAKSRSRSPSSEGSRSSSPSSSGSSGRRRKSARISSRDTSPTHERLNSPQYWTENRRAYTGYDPRRV